MENILETFQKQFDIYGFGKLRNELIGLCPVDVRTYGYLNVTMSENKKTTNILETDIKDVFFFENGIRGESMWKILGQLNNGEYFYFYSYCSKNGFEDSGGIHLICHVNFLNILQIFYSDNRADVYFYKTHEDYEQKAKSRKQLAAGYWNIPRISYAKEYSVDKGL